MLLSCPTIFVPTKAEAAPFPPRSWHVFPRAIAPGKKSELYDIENLHSSEHFRPALRSEVQPTVLTKLLLFPKRSCSLWTYFRHLNPSDKYVKVRSKFIFEIFPSQRALHRVVLYDRRGTSLTTCLSTGIIFFPKAHHGQNENGKLLTGWPSWSSWRGSPPPFCYVTNFSAFLSQKSIPSISSRQCSLWLCGQRKDAAPRFDSWWDPHIIFLFSPDVAYIFFAKWTSL